MRLRRISWQNYRRLPDASIEVRKHLVLVGPNDSGKSSILRAVNLCLGVSGTQLVALIEPGDFGDPSEPLLIQVVLDEIEDEDRAVFPDEISVVGGDILTVEVEATVEGGDPEQKQVRRWFPDAGHGRSPSRIQLRQFGWAFVSATRSLGRELSSNPTSIVRTLLSSVDLQDDSDAFAAASASFQDALQASEALESLREELSGALSGALPASVSASDLKITSESELLDDPLAAVTITMSDGERTAPLAEQSDGFRAISLLALLGISHKLASIVGVDEPETHLHLTAQRAIAARLRTGGGQRILATHSPSIVREMDPLDIVTMGADRRPRQLEPDADMADIESSTRHWCPQLIEPLTARRVLLVEGPSDRIMCERVGALSGFDLHREGVSIVELGGSGMFGRAYRLFGPAGFDLSLFGLLDEDALDEWAEVVGCSPDVIESDGRFKVCLPDLEADYVRVLGVDRTAELLLKSPSISESMIRGACGCDLADLTADLLGAYCRHKKRKVRASLAVAAGLTSDEAKGLGAVAEIVRTVAA